VSTSSTEKISSGLMSGSVFRIGIVQFALAAGTLLLPGLTSRNMSFSPVLGRSSAVASVWISPLYSGSMSIVTMARPFFSETPPMSPIRTPATRTVWPWPATTAWAVAISAVSLKGADWMSGKRRRSLWST
jgi:hypothetical protein